MLASLFRRRPDDAAVALYRAAVDQARAEDFYRRLGVPDTVDGRFELVALHLWLLLRRLKGEPAAAGFAQDLVEVFFADMDVSLRELGAADIGVGRRVKRMVEALHGRAAAYDKALLEGPAALDGALGRNLYGTVAPSREQLDAAAAYLLAAEASLRGQPLGELLAGRAAFPPVPAP